MVSSKENWTKAEIYSREAGDDEQRSSGAVGRSSFVCFFVIFLLFLSNERRVFLEVIKRMKRLVSLEKTTAKPRFLPPGEIGRSPIGVSAVVQPYGPREALEVRELQLSRALF